MAKSLEQLMFWESIKLYDDEIDSVLNEESQLTRIIRGIPFNNKTVIDIGSGSGNLFRYIGNCKKIMACDFSKNMLALSKDTASKLGLSNVEYIELDILENHTSVPGDILFSINGFFPESYSDIERFMRNIRNSINENGEIYILLSSFVSFIEEAGLYSAFALDRYLKERTRENFEKFINWQDSIVSVQGYFHCGKRVRKYWLKEEIRKVFSSEFRVNHIRTINFKRKNIKFNFKRFLVKLTPL